MKFDDPLYILFSSGTTGKPKCIVHGVGRALLQHKKELSLHCDLGEGDRILYYTTCGWMMWNWMVSALSLGATVVCYEGSPIPDGRQELWKAVEDLKIQCFGTSPRFLRSCQNCDFAPRESYALSSLNSVLSTGAPLAPEQFEWVHSNVKKDLHLASISGGTDIVSCFVLGQPWSPVYKGEIQGPGLGMAVESWDEHGNRVVEEKGELVCTVPFVSMPLYFWGDEESKKFKSAYFERFSGVWHHGDYLMETEHGGFQILGRSDATLNPGGVRMGTAEIYDVVEGFDEVEDSIVVGIEYDEETHVVLFVVASDTSQVDEALIQKIRKTIRSRLSPRHVPSLVLSIGDIPYTRSGKKVEIAVRKVLEGQKDVSRSALKNPESLDKYAKINIHHLLSQKA